MSPTIGYTTVEAAKIDDTFRDYIDLAVATRGGQVLFQTDEWFAEAKNLVTAAAPVSRPGVFTANGAWYDGWETRRHNPKEDWCVIQLGYPGTIAGFEVDTAYFTGNHAPQVAVEGLFLEESAAKLLSSSVGASLWEALAWEDLLPAVALTPSARHGFLLNPAATTATKAYTHVRFRMIPDGGVARLRVYGSVAKKVPLDKQEVFDLAAVGAGGVVEAFSDAHYGHPSNMLLPGRGKDMSDGWETKRSRSPGHLDWCTIKLGVAGHASLIEVDTAHYKGNPPKAVTIEGFSESDPTTAIPLIQNEAVQPHRQHFFQLPEAISQQKIASIKVTMIPDGGIKRVRVFGAQAWPAHPLSPSIGGQRQLLPDEETWQLLHVTPVPITNENFERWGQVVRLPDADPNAVQVNQGTAQKFSHLAKIVNTRSAEAVEKHGLKPAEANVAIFKCYKPVETAMFGIRLLERHPYSSQMFLPMGGDGNGSYVVVCAENGEDDKPILATMQAFRCDNTLGINYRPNVWHHPMIVIEKPVQFMTFTHESGVALEDCEEYWFTKESGKEGGSAAMILLK
ncbi:Allantoicase [Actinomortierella ambigua]|nr:Allantoicase [Actinomortierella ambigua]